jgi:hypothetical protein
MDIKDDDRIAVVELIEELSDSGMGERLMALGDKEFQLFIDLLVMNKKGI